MMQSQLFNGVPPEYLRETMQFFCKTRLFAPYDLVIKEGNSDRDLFHIEEGTALIKVGGKEVGALQVGDIFGEVGFCACGKRTASVFAGPEGATCRVIGPEQFAEYGAKRPKIAFDMSCNLANLLASKLQRTNQTLRSSIGRIEELEGQKAEQELQEEGNRNPTLLQRLFSSLGAT